MKQAVPAQREVASAQEPDSPVRGTLAHPLQQRIDNSPRHLAQGKKLAQLRHEARDESRRLPAQLRAGIETLSGMDRGHVVVHRHSAMPAQLNALAYAQGNEIHLGPGQEKHLPHEAWHVVQPKQGGVEPTTPMKGGISINDDQGLEAEADAMGEKARSAGGTGASAVQLKRDAFPVAPVQRIQEPAAKKKRNRESDEKSNEPSRSLQPKKAAAPLQAKIAQLAIDDYVEAGTRVMVTNPSAADAGDIGTVLGRSTTKARCMRVEFDNERGVAYRVYFHEITVIPARAQQQERTEPQLLNDMIMNVIAAVQAAPDELALVMESDRTGPVAVSPAQQLQACRAACAHFSAEETALYLYTTYFFSPLNKYLRNPLAPNMTARIKELISVTHALLVRAFKGTQAGDKLLPTFRMELQAEWIGAKGVGENLSFPAFTSTHPDTRGIDAMWGDIDAGTFGAATKLALLIFEGGSKILNPEENKKYFPNENEVILPSGIQTRIEKKYDITWNDTTVTVYHLKLPGGPGFASPELAFSDDGNLREAS